MKRSSFVCMGATGNKDSLVYQEIPGRESGEEFFLFFAAGSPSQDTLLRTLFREAVSASRLGAPLHYFSRFIERFAALTEGAAAGDDPLAGALLLIQIRRGDDACLLCNRDALLLHWDGTRGTEEPVPEIPGFQELPLAGPSDQRDLFHRSPEDYFRLFQYAIAGDHTLVLVPSRDFAERHAETLRDSIFFPSFEIPRETGLVLPVDRSFPVLQWRVERGEILPGAGAGAAGRRARLSVAAVAAAGIVIIAAVITLRGGWKRPEGEGRRAELVAMEASRENAPPVAADAPGSREPARMRPAAVIFDEAWKQTFAGPVTSSPAIAGETVFFGCRDGHLYAYDPAGKLLWKYRASGGIGASPACIDGRVFCADYGGRVFCLDGDGGSLLWKLELGAKIVSSPAAADDILYAATTDGRIAAVRLRDGKLLWQKKVGASIRATPAAGRNYVVVATTDGVLAKLDGEGKFLWRATIGGEILSSPECVEQRGIVVIGGPDRALHARSLATGESVWRFAVDGPVLGSPRIEDGVIYVGARSGSVYAVDLDGNERWRGDAGGAVLSKPLVKAGLVFVTTYGSQLVALDTEAGAIIARYRTSSPVFSSPESDGKRVFFGSNGGVFHALWLAPPA